MARLQSIAGDINVPIPGWGNWDLDANLYAGHINVDSKVGYQTRPTNYLNIKPETLALLGQNPEFRKARSKSLSPPSSDPNFQDGLLTSFQLPVLLISIQVHCAFRILLYLINLACLPIVILHSYSAQRYRLYCIVQLPCYIMFHLCLCLLDQT